MAKKYYIDACIWIDFFDNRSDRFRPLGDWAIELLNKIVRENGLIIISDHLINELKQRYTKDDIDKLLR